MAYKIEVNEGKKIEVGVYGSVKAEDALTAATTAQAAADTAQTAANNALDKIKTKAEVMYCNSDDDVSEISAMTGTLLFKKKIGAGITDVYVRTGLAKAGSNIPTTYYWLKLASEGVNNSSKYSEHPTSISTWIDGTPVWRVCVDDTITSEASYYDVTCVRDINAAKIINQHMMLYHDGDMVGDRVEITIGPGGGAGEESSWYYTRSDIGAYTNIYGFIEFVTPQSNLK